MEAVANSNSSVSVPAYNPPNIGFRSFLWNLIVELKTSRFNEDREEKSFKL